MKKLLTFPTPPNDPRIVAGYSEEMLTLAISQLSQVKNPGEWEIERLAFLKAERDRRKAAA
ncbi:hypothetical protein JIN84_18025 [Luteolibacter yonseiensis]|uniref:Uncharacterized protein n=1 Tax=Luteolibacter yonseiensis TaxID=1144680 RepID=A0A934VDF9_9BACT|nr:hypothetical protein [Luteolibacter yonseiensis]MBK1817524.1 hypothetical protein [Luteolibacter yonseiensis]